LVGRKVLPKLGELIGFAVRLRKPVFYLVDVTLNGLASAVVGKRNASKTYKQDQPAPSVVESFAAT
jgi:hypothetical protein